MRKSVSLPRLIAGFTLVEVMMATMILTVGFMGLIQAVTICSGMMDQARRESLATQILDHEIEKLRFLPWNNGTGANDIVDLTSGSLSIDPQFDSARTALGDNLSGSSPVTFSLSRVRSNSGDPLPSLFQVTVTVTWVVTSSRHDSSGSPVTFTYQRVNTAYLGNNGLNLTYQRS